MATVTKPIALDESLHTTEQTPRNLADVLAEELSAIITAIGGLNFINFVVVAELPTTGISTTTIYLVPSDDPQSGNTYDEYINLNGTVSGWEKIGSTDIDLSGYYTSAEVDDLLADKADVSDIPTVNDGTLTIQQNGETKGTFTANQSGNSTVNIETPTTDIQTAVDEFETYNGGILSSLKVALTPNQDLHGYDSPWVGGSRKNKCPLTVDEIKSANTTVTWNGNSCVFNGVTITILTDTNNNVIGLKFLGTASSYFYFNVNSNFTIDGTYIISPLPQGAAYSSAFYGRLYYTDGTDIGFLSSEVTVTKQNAVGRMQIAVSTNATVDFTYQPMLRLSTESDPTFEPYTNECPISGHTQVDVDVSDGDTTQEQVTVNLGGTYYSGTLDVVSGVFVVDGIVETFDGTDETWFKANDGTPNWYYFISVNSNYLSTLICDTFNNANITNSNTDTGIGMTGAGTANAYIRIRTALGELSIPDWKTWLSNNNIHVYFPLATPTTIQLSPTMVKALVGENHLSAPLDGQDITESKYKQMFTFDDVIAYIQSLS